MTEKTKILLVDDEPAITIDLAQFLQRAGFAVATAGNGLEALHRINQDPPDLVVLDILMPRMDGRETLRELRRAGNWTPVIMLTQVSGTAERSLALDEGADDYINKPFDPKELVSRIRAVLRRARPGQKSLAAATWLVCGNLRLNRHSRQVFLRQREVVLTPKAVRLLEYLITHPGEVISRERLLDAVWGWDYAGGTRAVDVRIAELRRALEEPEGATRYIETIAGEGYRFAGEVEVLP